MSGKFSLAQLARGVGLQRQRVHGARQFLGEGGVDHALSRHAALPLESGGFDHHIEVAFAAAVVTRVPVMTVAVIDDFEAEGGESLGQLVTHRLGDLTHTLVNP